MLKTINMPAYKRLIRFIFRRERVITSLWLFFLVFITVAIALALDNIYGGNSGALMAESMKNPAMVAMMGPVYGADNYTTGAMNSNMMLLFTVIAVALMNIFFVVRHTRRDEERGRAEIIRSLPVNRLTSLCAVMTAASIINLALSVLSGIGLAVIGVESMDFVGSMLYGAALGVSGLYFAAVAALFAQLFSNARAVSGAASVFLGICYIVRAAGDIGNETLALISPLGLILRVQAYVNNYWQPVLIVFLQTVLITVLAFYLNSKRDMNQSLISAKPGKKTASPMLCSPLGLAFRLTRTVLISWFIGMFIFGAAYGSVMSDLENFIRDNEFFAQIMPAAEGHSMTETFITVLMAVLSMVSAIPAVNIMLRLRGEEKRNRAEHILTGTVTRTRYMAGYFIISLASSFIMLFASVFGLWSASIAVMEEVISFGALFKAMMVYLPALWITISVTVFIIGLLPDLTSIAWIFLGYSFFSVYMGRVMQFPDWVKKLSPFGYIPQLPLEEINYAVLAVLTAIAVILTAAGFFFYAKRDIKPN